MCVRGIFSKQCDDACNYDQDDDDVGECGVFDLITTVYQATAGQTALAN